MLALTRGVDETIKIYTSDGVISVTVAAVRGGGQVRLQSMRLLMSRS